MPAGSDFLQRLSEGGARSCGGDRRDGRDVHQIDHRNRSVGFGEHRGNGRKSARSEARPSELGRQGQPEQPGPSERVDGFGGEPAFPVVLPRGGGQHISGYLCGL